MPVKSGYTTLVTTGGLGFRGIIPVVILIQLEDLIKDHILNEVDDPFPDDSDITEIDDFNIHLADYIDCFSGTSSGSWIALYLASKGANGQSKGIFEQRRVRNRYGVISPGSARGLMVFFQEFGDLIYPQDQATANLLMLGEDPATPGVGSPLLNGTGLQEALNEFFGDSKLSQLKTSCLVTSYDLESRAGIMFVFDSSNAPRKYGFTSSVRSEDPKSEDTFQSSIEPNFGQDFFLRDLAIGSGSTPVVFPAHEVELEEENQTLLLAEGTLFYGQEILPAAIQVASSIGDTSFSNLAVLSLGPGLTVPNLEDNINGGAVQWVLTGELALFSTEVTTEYVSKQTEYFFAANPVFKAGQYLRIQPFGEANTERGGLLSRSRVFEDLLPLEEVGEEFAELYRPALESFVEQFIFS